MADRTSEDIKEVEESSLRAFLEKSLAAIVQKQDSQFQELKKVIAQKQDSQFQDSEPQQMDTDLKSPEIKSFDGSTDQDEDHEHHRAPNSNFIIEVEESSLRDYSLEKSLVAIAQKQDYQFQELKKLIAQKQDSQFQELKKLIARKQDSQFHELKKLIIQLNSRKTSEITSFDGSIDQGEDHEHHLAPNSTFIIEEGTTSKLLPSPPPTWKYDVFVSFRGPDTRRSFVSHLFDAFKREGINCYRDVDGNERGQKVDSMLIEAIHRSKMAIVVLSRNYADSKWCLGELVEILSWNKQHRIHGHLVLPIFYDVSARDVRHLEGMVWEAFQRCIDKNGEHNENIWKNALQQAGSISSWSTNNRDEASIIQEIVEVLLVRLAYSRNVPLLIKSSIVPNNNVSHFRTMLDTMNNDVVRTVGICGAEGIGKTTLAHAACVHLNNVFEGHVILLEAIPAEKTTKDHLLQIQSKIAAELLKDDKLFQLSEDVEKNKLEIRRKLAQKKVLIILDNVTTLEQTELGLVKDLEKFLGPGSRVVIISRDWGLLDKLKVDDIYVVPHLNHEDSLKLFYHYAFMGRQDLFNAIEGSEELSKNIVHYTAGVPQTLESLGYSLSNAPETEWHTKLRELVRSTNRSDSKYFQYGPFGGRGQAESRWDDGEHCDVSGIELVIVDSVIKSIGVTYNNYGHPVGPVFHGSSISSSTIFPEKIQLDYPYEYLMAISGYIGKKEASQVTVVRSLTLHSNTRTLGPFGDESKTGWPFYSQKFGAKIVGFFGAGDSELQFIGVHAKQLSHTYPQHQSVGPFGQNSTKAVDWDHGAFTDIRKITITEGRKRFLERRIPISISCVYDNEGIPVEKLQSQSKPEKFNQVEVILNYPDEYIVSVSGSYCRGSRYGRYVSSLTFQTNLKTYGPYGIERGRTFSTPLGLGKIVGFYGTEIGGGYIETIGAHLAPVYHTHPLTTIGPFGQVYKHTWDDGKHSGVKRIHISHCGDTISYMKFTYADGQGRTVEGRVIGCSGQEDVAEVIKLDYPKEYLVSISGLTRSLKFNSVVLEGLITSVSFKTNLREIGPYGEMNEGEGSFSFKSDIAKIVGFHGTIKAYYGFSIGPSGEIIKDNKSFSCKPIAKILGFHETDKKYYGYSIGPHLQLL